MLEGLVANLLNRFLGLYVRNFDPKQLNVGIWSGDVKLRNLELRREALDQLKLPINVVEGHIGLLTLTIPWSNLRGKPVRVNIEDVLLLAAPKEDQEYDPAEEEKRQHVLKMEKLDSAELLKERNTEGMSQEEQAKNQSFTASLTTAIVDNLQISVKNVHIRYEDSISDPGHPFAVGVTLQELSAVSTDENWKPTFIQSTSDTTHKLSTLGALALYWDTDVKLLGSGKGSQTAEEQGIDHDKILERLKEMIAKKDATDLNDHQYILKPVTGRAGLEMDKSGKTDRPKTKARLLFNELGFILDDDQYRDALRVVDLFHYFTRHQEYRKLQPKASPKEDPRAWLRFAGKAVLDKIHERNRQWSWGYLKERRDDRVRYIELFKKKKKEEKFTPQETTDLEALEKKLSYEDLRFWRSLARNQLRKENVGVKKQPQKQTWGQWIWGSKDQQQSADDSQMTDEQRQELYSAIDFDEKKQLEESIDLPREAVKLQVDMSLKEGSFTLKRDAHGRNNEMLKLVFQGLDTKFLQRTDSMLAELSLDAMKLKDGTTDGNLFEQALRVKDSRAELDDDRFEDVTDTEEGKAAKASAKQEKAKLRKEDAQSASAEKVDDDEEEALEDPFFALSFEQNPLDGKADTKLSVKLKAMEYVYNPKFAVEVAKFFKPPERHMESIGALMETAGARVEGLRQQTRAGLEYALTEHKTIDAQLDLQAPLIIVPDSVTQQSTICMILDAGHIAVRSELIDKDTMNEIQSKQKQKYTEEDVKRLEALMYDKFIVSLSSTQVLLGPSIDETREQLDKPDRNKSWHIVERINMDFNVEICIIPKTTELTKFRVAGHLPVLHASVSDAKYKSMMKLIEVAIPRFETDEAVVKPAAKPEVAKKRESKSLQLPTRRDRSSSFQFSAQRHAIVMEDESDHDEDGKEEKFYDTQQGDDPADSHVEQRNFEFKFKVDELRGSLYRADPEGKKPDELLVDLIAQGFDLEFYQRPFDMAAEIRLRKLAVEDHIEQDPSPEFKNLISSEDVFTNKQEDLFTLKFVKVNKDHPRFISEYEGTAMNLDVAVSTINLLVTRRTLLTLLDFVLATFTNQSPEPKSQSKIQDSDTESVSDDGDLAAPAEPDKIRVKARLKRIAVILNNDGIRLATLSLNSAEVVVLLLGKTMRVSARLGNLTLIDDVNQGVSKESSLRQLVSIQGDELADFSYETFDPESEVYPGHDTAIKLKSGSLKVNFVTEPFRKIMEFGVKFGKMQAIFNAARQAAANQAQNMQQRASKMHFDVRIKTPIVAFPRMVITDSPERDLLVAYLGEIYAKNEFVALDDTENSDIANKLSAGIQNIRLTSNFNYEGGKTEELELIDKVDLDFKITSAEHREGRKRPDTEIEGSMSNLNMKVTEAQFKFLMELSKSIPQAFATDPSELDDDLDEELPSETTAPAKSVMSSPDSSRENLETAVSKQSPEIGSSEESWTKLDFVFKVGTIGLELISGRIDEPVGDLEAASLSKFSLNETNVKLRMVSDGSMESELLVQSFTITDTRTKDKNKFRKVMSLINTDIKQQFMASISISAGEEKNLIALLTIDSPRVILALDHVFALQAFVAEGLKQDDVLVIEDEESEVSDDTAADDISASAQSDALEAQGSDESSSSKGGMSISFRVNVVDAQVILLANPAINSSEAIVLGVKQVLISQQHVTTLQVDKIGMFLCRMDKFDSTKLRILDDFSIQTSLDMRQKDQESSLTSIEVDIEPLVLRLSIRDIKLALQIFQNAASKSANQNDHGMADEAPAKLKQVQASQRKSTPTTKGKAKSSVVKQTAKTISTKKSTGKTGAAEAPQGSAILKREEMKIHFDGMRVVLIGDAHELPFLDWSVKRFDIEVRDWSGSMTADAGIDTFFNVFNFSKSAWEPLIEPWQIGFHMAKSQHPDKLSLELYSRKSLEITLTSATIALASKSSEYFSSDEDVLSKPRGIDAPFRVRNYTGFDLNIWAHSERGEEGAAAKMSDGEEIPWRFEDATTTRETLSPEGASGLIGIKLEGSGFDSIDRIAVSREGESLYNLRPRRDNVQHRLLVEVKLGADNVKNIILRSPLLVENNTQVPIEIGVFDREERHITKIDKIAPGESRSAPVGAAYMHSVVVRPDPGFGYAWSEHVHWKELLKRPTRALACKSESQDNAPSFYFQMQSVYDKKDPISAVYPNQRIKLSAPVEIQNLLPYDFKYRIYDKNTKKDWTNFLRKGGVSPVHVVELSHLLLMSVDLQDTPFKPSEFAIINSSDRENFSREKILTVKDKNDLNLQLKLHYYNVPDSGGAFKVTVYSPYVILNRTGVELDVRSKAFFGATKSAAGQNTFMNTTDPQKATPFMFSFPTDDKKNRALLKISGSQWSKPVSFDAIGSTVDITFPAESGRSEMHCGLTVVEGEGKYKLTRVVTLAPRYVIKNKIGEDLNIREPGSSDVVTLKSGDLHPLRYLKQTTGQQLCFCFPGVNNTWSSPFDIGNVGSVHVKLAKAGERQKLIRVEILMENATIFLHVSIETKNWPFSMRNESDTEFLFWQANPNVEEDEDENTSGWKPIRYRLPPRSIMPYAWDYPATRNKNLVLCANKKERHVKLQEIGNLLPMRLPPAPGTGRQKVIDLNVMAEGPSQTLVLSNWKPQTSLYKQNSAAGSTASTSNGFEVKEQDSDVTLKAEIRFAGIGLSLVNRQMRELIYLTLRDIDLTYKDSKLYQMVSTEIKWIQIDNQLYGGIFPLLFYPSVVPKTGKEMAAHPIFKAAVTKVKDDSYGVLYIKYFTFLMQQMTIEIDEDFIFALLDFTKIPGASWSEVQEGKLCDENLDIPEPKREQSDQDIYFELLHLQPMQFDLSFVRTERINAEDTGSSTSNPFLYAVNVLTMSIGNVNDAPIKYNALMLENARVSMGALISAIQSHYVQESLRQVHIVLGSADFLGNPVGLFNNISSGVADIFYEPYQGLVMTDRPQDLGIGIAKGASSFVKKSVFGFSDSMAKFTGSISKGLAAASMDKEFQNQRRMTRARNRPKHALYGITSGGNAFATSLASGIGGLARHPLEGAEKEGALGFVKGVGKGVLGMATKPALGAFDLASNLAEGVRNTTTVFDQEGLDRVRMPRFIGQDGIVRPYVQREALGQFWLKTLDNGKYFGEEYIAHLELSAGQQGSQPARLVMLTYNGILLVQTKKLTTEWDVPLKDIKTISKERSGMSIVLKGGTNGPFIPIADEQSRNWFYRQVAVAVNAYNDRWNAKG